MYDDQYSIKAPKSFSISKNDTISDIRSNVALYYRDDDDPPDKQMAESENYDEGTFWQRIEKAYDDPLIMQGPNYKPSNDDQYGKSNPEEISKME